MPELSLAGVALDDLFVGHEGDVDPHTGDAVVAVPVPLSQGRSGFTPALTLRYSSTGGNSVVGAGWSLSGLPSVTVDTGDELPRYDGSDRFALAGVELVVSAAPAAVRGDFLVRDYRCKYQGSLLRVEQWCDAGSGRVHWRSIDADDVVTIYGRDSSGESRIADPADDRRVYAWLPESRRDGAGNTMSLRYLPDNADGVEGLDVFERARVLTAPGFPQRYLKFLRYGNTADGAWRFEAVLDYGDHTGEVPAAEPDRPWPMRVDPHSTCRPGFELRTTRLCRRILMFHRFAELGAAKSLVRAVELEHEPDPAGTRLTVVRLTGFRDGARRSLPPLSLRYATAAVAPAFEPAAGSTADIGASRWVDLLGEGLPGLLDETPAAWYFRRNEGGGRFGVPQVVPARPARAPDGTVLADFDLDGNVDAVALQGRAAGFASRDRDTGRWEAFRPFAAVPHMEAGGAAQWLDLNGDGLADLIVSHADRFTWFPSRGRDGFGAAVEIPKPQSPGMLQAHRIAEDAALDYQFADMTGDGLPDLVRVRNGRVEYWPHLGHGRFGAGVLLADSPVFDPIADFDPARLHLVDLDGSGTADLVYLTRDGLRCWTNAGGNRLVERPALRHLPSIENLASVIVLDYLGDGTPCLVWSSSVPGRAAAVQYLRLTDGAHPRLLLSVDNGMGREVRLEYASSAAHYLRDRDARDAWHTRLPHHKLVVQRREVIDHIGGTTAVSRFEYRDGRYDGRRRAFAGFDVVDRYDAELCVRTWFHPGVPRPDDAFDALGTVSETLSTEDVLDGAQALAGLMVRQETYAGDPHGDPLTVTEQVYRVRRTRPGCFEQYLSERLEADVQGRPDDARITHRLTLAVNGHCLPTLTASVAYARRSPPPGAPESQTRHLVTATALRMSEVDDAEHHLLGVEVERREFEVDGLVPPAGGQFAVAGLAAAVTAAIATPVPHGVPFTGGVQARVLAWEQVWRWRADGTGALPFGQVEAPALIHHRESACCTAELVAAVFGDRIDPAALRADGGYTQRDGYWWQSGPVSHYADFHLLTSLRRADGSRTDIAFDEPYLLAPVRVTDELGNTTVAELDYHLVEPARVTDANGAVAEVRCDPLGVAVVSSWQGGVFGQPYGHDPLTAWRARPAPAVAEMLADPAGYVQRAATFVAYDLDAWSARSAPVTAVVAQREELVHDGRGTAAPVDTPRLTVTYRDGFGRPLQSKVTASPGLAVDRDAAGRVRVDAAGHPVLTHADRRWLVTGHVVYDDQQRAVQRYEPFYSATVDFEPDAELARFGVSATTIYDVLGRMTEERLPNGTARRVEYEPWLVRRHDPNDTVADSRYRLEREALPDTEPEKQALVKALAHAGTPAVVELDPAGREVRFTELLTPTEARSTTRILDAAGNATRLVDERGLDAFRHVFDLRGNVLHTDSVDGGETWVMPDAYDRPMHAWDGRGVHHRRRFDTRDRPISLHVDGAVGPGIILDHVVEDVVYGDDARIAQAAQRNARGRPVRHRDSAGEHTVLGYTPDGLVLREERRLRTVYAAEVDWAAAGGVPLETESFVTERTFDALGRMRREFLPDGTRRRYEQLREGGVARILLSTADNSIMDAAVLDTVRRNARGQRTEAVLGNGVTLSHRYDTETFQLAQVTTRRTGADPRTLLDLTYTYDPAGNVVHAVDAVQQPTNPTPLLQGLTVSAHQEYTYDALYRLRVATGRVHQALLEHDYRPGLSHPGGGKGTRHLTLANGAAVERYTQTYTYDRAGNLEQLRHQGATRSWTTDLWVSGTSNRSVPRLDPGGLPVTDPQQRFDPTGNLTWLPQVRTLRWNHHGALAAAVFIDRTGTGDPDDAEYYAYDGSGRRVRKVSERWVSGQVEIVEKVYLDGCEVKRIRNGADLSLERFTSHVGDGTGRIALLHRWSVDAQARETADPQLPRWHYQVGNHLDTAVLDLDADGAVIGYEEYLPYGGTAFLAGDRLREVPRRDYRYCGKERDDATGLYYFGQRYYAPWLGRWLSPDPAGPQETLNLYQYVLGNPVSLVDPNGLTPAPAAGGGVIGVELSADERKFLNGMATKAFGALPPQRQQQLLREGYFYSFNRSLQFTFHTPGEARRTVDQLARKEKVGVIRQQSPPPPPTPKPPEPPARPSDALAAPAPPGSQGPPGSHQGVEHVPAGAKGPQSDAADAKGTTASADTAASKTDGADGGEQTESAAGKGTGTDAPGSGPGPGPGSGSGQRDAGTGGGGTDETRRGPANTGAGTGAGTLGGGLNAGADAGTDPPPAPAEQPPPLGTEPPVEPGATVDGPPPVGPASAEGTDRQGSVNGGGDAPGGTADIGEHRKAGGTGTGQGTGTGHSGTGSGPAPDLLMLAVEIAGKANFVFDRPDGGDPGGLPGSLGLFNWRGPAVQLAYVVYTIVNTVLMLKAIANSVSGAAMRQGLGRLVTALRNPMTILRGLRAAAADLAAEAVQFARQLNGRRFVSGLRMAFVEGRTWQYIRGLRNNSFLFRERLFGLSPFYNTEHIIAQSWFGTGIGRFLGNSYLNTFLRLPMPFNSALGNRVVPKLLFYWGAGNAVHKSWLFGHDYLGPKLAEKLWSTPTRTEGEHDER